MICNDFPGRYKLTRYFSGHEATTIEAVFGAKPTSRMTSASLKEVIATLFRTSFCSWLLRQSKEGAEKRKALGTPYFFGVGWANEAAHEKRRPHKMSKYF